MRTRVLLALAASSLLAGGASAGLTVADGFSVTSLPVAPGGALDALPGGDLVLFDGASLVVVDPATGGVHETLFTPSGPVFASFVRTDPTGTYVLFGESSNHDVWRVPLDGSAPSVVANVPWNYACAFRAPGKAVITHADPSWTTTTITLLDVETGALDPLAAVPGPSGPVAFDAAGDLYYGTNHASYPAPPHEQSVLRFPAALVESAVGPATLTGAQAAVFASEFTAVSAFAFDGEGDLLVADSVDAVVAELSPTGAPKGTVGVEVAGSSPGVGPMAFVDGATSAAQFAPYQPESAGALYVLSTDFVSFNHLNRVTPHRPSATVSPGGPLPAGPFTFAIDDGPASAFGLLFVASAPIAGEELAVPHGETTFLVGFDPGALIATATVLLDGAGSLAIGAHSPGGALSLVAQAALWDPQLGPVGTTTTLALEFQ